MAVAQVRVEPVTVAQVAPVLDAAAQVAAADAATIANRASSTRRFWN